MLTDADKAAIAEAPTWTLQAALSMYLSMRHADTRDGIYADAITDEIARRLATSVPT